MVLMDGMSASHVLWIAFLRASADYWWICKEQGDCLDPRLVQVWKDFGDVFRYNTLYDWWLERGQACFESRQPSLPDIPAVSLPEGLRLMSNAEIRQVVERLFYVSVDAELAMKHQQAELGQALALLAKQKKREACATRYPLLAMDGKSRKKIVPSYQAIVLEQYTRGCSTDDPAHRWGCYEMGRKLGMGSDAPKGKVLSQERERKRQVNVRSLFCQAKKGAQALIANVEIGRFPSKKAVSPIPRWTDEQYQKRNQSLWQNRWSMPAWLAREQRFFLGAHATIQSVPSYLNDLATWVSLAPQSLAL
jgi:hypothetical protein